ncbi:hypothetical protein [Chromobacterium phragmitis]|uniref:Uncharacterized protein n=1 Tax=Chromobacterium phragmitis TaxID=2202141 RepID=A0ABV0ISW2_9NEIS
MNASLIKKIIKALTTPIRLPAIEKKFETITFFLATIISSSALYYTREAVIESENQRAAGEAPQVIPKPFIVQINVICHQDLPKKIQTTTTYDMRKWDSGNFSMQVVNIGKGAANDVSYSWHPSDPKHLTLLARHHIEWDSTKEIFKEYPYQSNSPEQLTNNSFILPSDQEKFNSVTPSPHLLKQLEMQLHQEAGFFHCSGVKISRKLYGPSLTIRYSDIEGRPFKKSYIITYIPILPFKNISENNKTTLTFTYKIYFDQISQNQEQL